MKDWEIEADFRADYEECCKEEFIDFVNECFNTVKMEEIEYYNNNYTYLC